MPIQCPNHFSGSYADRKAILLAWYWEGICGTKNQHMPVQYLNRFSGSLADRKVILLAWYWEGICGTQKISICPYSARITFLGATRTEKRFPSAWVLEGHMRN